MRSPAHVVLAAAILLSLVAAPAPHCCAQSSIFSQLPIQPRETITGPISTYGGADNGPNARFIADGFALTASASISTIRFWCKRGFFGSGEPQSFRVMIWNGDAVSSNGLAHSPGSVVFAHTFSVGDASFSRTPCSGPMEGADLYECTPALPISLAAEQRYWFSVGASDDWIWWEAPSNQRMVSYYNIFSTESWNTFEGQFGPMIGHSFELIGVPAPGGAAAGGLLGVGVLSRRRRRYDR